MERWEVATALSMPWSNRCYTSGCRPPGVSGSIAGLVRGRRQRTATALANEQPKWQCTLSRAGLSTGGAVSVASSGKCRPPTRPQEAVALLTKGLKLLPALPDTPERAQQELALYISLGAPLLMTQGYAAPEVEHAYTRAWQLCQQLEASPQLLLALAGLFRFTMCGQNSRHRPRGAGAAIGPEYVRPRCWSDSA